MCDTFVALPDSTADGSVILAKNSDREPNEAHELSLVLPASDHEPDDRLQCTYIAIDQAPRTRRVLLARPYWIWGAEMGMNDAGVAIGNEAVFTGQPPESEPGLLGMDLLRLALERAGSTDEAVAVITALLERHGQSGQAGHTHDLRYDNSYIIADPERAVILETMGRDWVVRRVRATDSISNAVTTQRSWDAASLGVTARVGEGSVAETYSDFLFTTFSAARSRQCRTSSALVELSGRITVHDAMTLLRDHGPAGDDAAAWAPDRALTGQTVCAHAGFGPIRVAQSTGSLVARLHADGATAWVTGTSAPCTSVFKPVWLDGGLPDLGPTPGRYADAKSLWWRHEALHREILKDFPTRLAVRRGQRDALEADLMTGARERAAEPAAFTAEAFARADAFEAEWLGTVRSLPNTRSAVPRLVGTPHRRAWRHFDALAHLR